jgi:hypothetical protein
MELFKTKIEDLLKFPFEKKDWMKTFGIYTLISLINSLVILALVFILTFGSIMLIEAMNTYMFAITGIFFLLLFAFFFIVQLYLQGYLLEMIKNVKMKKDIVIPTHTDIALKLKFGWHKFIIGLGAMFIPLLAIFISTALLIFAVTILETLTFLSVILIVFATLLLILAIFLAIFIGVMIIPAMLYLYIKYDSVKKAYCFKNIKLIVKNYWKEFLVLYAVTIVGTMLISTIGQIPGLGLLVLSIGTAYITFLLSFLTGRVFNQIDNLKLLEK